MTIAFLRGLGGFKFNAAGRGIVGCLLLTGVSGSLVAAEKASVSVKNLICEYRVDPIGLDVPKPRLSWQLEATNPRKRGQRQSRYRILVASGRQLLEGENGDRWDSGWVSSDVSVNVEYSGKPLRSGKECYWRVQIADEDGNLSAWSPVARWMTGLMDSLDWKGEWIGANPPLPRDRSVARDPWFRKSFDLPGTPAQATIYVASVGYQEVYINGQKVGDVVLEPCATDNRVRARYVTYEIGKYLKPGRNVIGLWLGTSWSIFPEYQTKDKPREPMVLAQADIDLKDGSRLQIVTDSRWKTHPSPNRLLGSWKYREFGGEEYDARREMRDWCDAKCDESSWEPCKTFHPSLVVSSETVEPNRRVEEIRPFAIEEITNGVYRVDMGRNYAGWLECRVTGQPGDRIDFEFSEREDAPITHNLHSSYIVGASGKGTFRNRFNYAVGRWVRITGLTHKPSKNDIRGWLIRTDYTRSGGFECDDPLLNKIYGTCLWTFENLSLGGYSVDCPQRERMGYGGDAHATTRTALDNYSLGAFYTKWSQDWRDVQATNGSLPHTAPTYWGGGGPAWSGYCITLPWEVYCHYGDKRILEENFPTMQRWLAFLETKSRNDTLVRWGGDWDFLGDWLWPGARGVNSDTRESLCFNNCYWIFNLEMAARIADILGQAETAEKYRERADEVRRAVHQEFYDPAAQTYVGGFPPCLAIALVADLPPKELRPVIWKRLEDQILVTNKGHICAGITGGAFLLKALLEANRNDLIYAMASKTNYPGWGDMIRRGETTFCEDWECKLSCLHSSYLYIGSWFIEGLGGIRYAPEARRNHYIIEPWLDPASGLHDVAAHYDSLNGRVATHWTRNNGQLRLRVSVPPNASADLRLHEVDGQGLREGGTPIEHAEGVTVASKSAGMAELELLPGNYDFRAQMTSPAH